MKKRSVKENADILLNFGPKNAAMTRSVSAVSYLDKLINSGDESILGYSFNGMHILKHALANGDYKLAIALINYGVTKGVFNENDEEKIYLDTAKYGAIKVAENLIARNENVVAAADKEGRNAMHFAAYNNQSEMISYLNGKDPDLKNKKSIFRTKDGNQDIIREGFTPLHAAAARGNLEAVKKLISLGADLGVVDFKGGRPLDYARRSKYNSEVTNVSSGELRKVKSILSKKGEFHPNDVEHIVKKGDVKRLNSVLEKNGAKLEASKGSNVLIDAIKNDDLKMVKEILKRNEAKDLMITPYGKREQTSLHIAAEVGNPKILKELLKASETIFLSERDFLNKEDKNGNTALLSGASKLQTKSVDVLLDAGANPLAINKDGKNILHLASVAHTEKKYDSKVKEIVSKIDPKSLGESENKALTLKSLLEKEDKNGKTPINLAKGKTIRLLSDEQTKLMFAKPAKVKAKDEFVRVGYGDDSSDLVLPKGQLGYDNPQGRISVMPDSDQPEGTEVKSNKKPDGYSDKPDDSLLSEGQFLQGAKPIEPDNDQPNGAKVGSNKQPDGSNESDRESSGSWGDSKNPFNIDRVDDTATSVGWSNTMSDGNDGGPDISGSEESSNHKVPDFDNDIIRNASRGFNAQLDDGHGEDYKPNVPRKDKDRGNGR